MNAPIAVHQLRPPPGEQLERLVSVFDFIPEIVGPAAEGINVIKVLTQFPRQRPGDDREILVMSQGYPAAIGVCLVQGNWSIRSLKTGESGPQAANSCSNAVI